MLILAAILTVCFLAMIALMLTAPEGHQIEGVGFIYGPEQPLDASEGGENPRPAVCLSSHSATDSAGTQDDHAGR